MLAFRVSAVLPVAEPALPLVSTQDNFLMAVDREGGLAHLRRSLCPWQGSALKTVRRAIGVCGVGRAAPHRAAAGVDRPVFDNREPLFRKVAGRCACRITPG